MDRRNRIIVKIQQFANLHVFCKDLCDKGKSYWARKDEWIMFKTIIIKTNFTSINLLKINFLTLWNLVKQTQKYNRT